MRETYSSTVAVGAGKRVADWLPALYLGLIIIVSCAACLLPIELFLIEIWPRHGFYSLLLFIAPLVGGSLIGLSLSERYYRIRAFESSGRIYERLGIRFFKRFVPNGDYINRLTRHFAPGHRVVHDGGSLAKFEARTEFAERCHLAGLFLGLPSAAYALILGWNGFALWLLLPNITFHLYPFLLQRYTRARIQKVLERRRK